MRKLLLLLITLATFIHVSYASFPIVETRLDTPIVDTIPNTESTDAYHLRIQKMGFDLNSCKCESCRNGIAPLTNNREGNKPSNQFKRIWLPIIIIMTILGAILVIFLYRYVDKHSGATPLG